MDTGKQWIIILLISIVITMSFYQMAWMRNTSESIKILDARVELTANSSQFDVGAYWGYQSVALYLQQKQNPKVNDVILQARAMHATAVLKSIQDKLDEAEETIVAEVEEKSGWWIFGKNKAEDKDESGK